MSIIPLMTDLQKTKLSQVLVAGQFWMVTLVLYFTNERGFSLSEIYTLLTIFSIAIIALEYPTGIFGDHFSHRNSLILGNLFSSVGLLLFTLPGGWHYYLIPLCVFAIGTALTSGSDTAFLHHTSSDFIRDYADVRIYSLITSAITITLGGYLASFDLKIPFYATSLFCCIAMLLLISTKKQNKDSFSGNMFARGAEGLSHVWNNRILFHLMFVSGIIGAFFLSFKWFYNPLLLEIRIPVSSWGLIIALAILLIALGTHLYKKYSSRNILFSFLVLLVVLFCIGFTELGVFTLSALLLSQLIRGYLDSQLNIEINGAISVHARAGILSLQSLLVRLFSSIYIFGAGFILQKTSFFVLMTITAGLLLLSCLPSILRIAHIHKSKSP